ncbi:uncharacterized protein LY79DRAFT_634012 [Colletotrichum navitas]|uniref:Uncharacterized protein n=1 Tax=Colletotrichum navitas TaxID=681940 RepID=A0AAD8V270_9PEZI|nr:uncharacterized protein LY79DRAFT_634012 [Colletotrichum navitas]KAK1586116.1 hypothetical protein LY79DRAFT_634012 [Colletotrichum navitas]
MSVPAAPALNLEIDSAQVGFATHRSGEESCANGRDYTQSPLEPALSVEMKKDLARIGFHRLALGKNDFDISDTAIDFKTAPGHMETTYVGHYSWLASWFPYNPNHITIYFISNTESQSFSIPETILVQNFEYFQVALKIKPSELEWKEQAEREFKLQRNEAGAFGLIISFLLTGTFPQHPDPKIRSAHGMIDDFITAIRLSDYTGLRCHDRFVHALCLRVRQLLLEDRTALQTAHIGKLYNLAANYPQHLRELAKVFAQAAVKPWMHCWMAKSTKPATISRSVAYDELCGTDPDEWRRVIKHYIHLVDHNHNFAVDVAKQVRKTMEESKRLNSIASATQDGANKTIHKLPEHVDYVTYRDPLVPGEGKVKTQLFTI